MKQLAIAIFVFILGSLSQANVLGNLQTLAPTPDSLVFQNIHASETVAKNYFNIGFFAAYVRNELSAYDNLVNPQFVNYKDKALTFDLIFAWGITDHLELTYALPGFIDQKPDSDQAPQHYISKGINGHRPGLKYNISQSKTGGFAIAGSVDFVSSVDNPYTGDSPTPIFNGELIYDHRNTDTAYGFNLGYRKRNPGPSPANAYFFPLNDQVLASAGYVMGLSKPWRFHAEVFGSYVLDKGNNPDSRYVSSLEVLLGTKHRFAKNLWGHLGATAEVLPNGLAPDYRVYAGLNYFFGFPQKKSEESAPAPLIAENLVAEENYTPASVTDETSSPNTIATNKTTLVVSPSETEVYTGGQVQFDISGGLPLYQLKLSRNFGTASSKSMSYSAPMRTGEVTIIVTDAEGNEARSLVRVIPVPTAGKEIVLENMEFAFNSNNLTKKSQHYLEKNLQELSDVNIQKIVVIGNTDSIGSEDYNQKLSLSRAQAIVQSLRSRLNLDASRIQAVGYGETKPIATNKTAAGRQKNRRVQLRLYYNK